MLHLSKLLINDGSWQKICYRLPRILGVLGEGAESADHGKPQCIAITDKAFFFWNAVEIRALYFAIHRVSVASAQEEFNFLITITRTVLGAAAAASVVVIVLATTLWPWFALENHVTMFCRVTEQSSEDKLLALVIVGMEANAITTIAISHDVNSNVPGNHVTD